LIAQLRGWLTRKRYAAATIIVDHYSWLSFVYLQQGTKSDKTMEAKRAFEAFAKSHGVTIRHYHANNGQFAEATYMEHCARSQQTITFCGANAHFQNSIAEKCIRDLQDLARTMLVHAKHRWPQAINAHLWPYALCMANDVHMHAPLRNGKAPLDLFSQVASTTAIPKHFHSFGCPVYVLSNTMQGGGKGSKWDERARVGIYLGNSPSHACSISLVLNTDTKMVSPQFHVKFDDLFKMVSSLKLQVQWHKRTSFTKSDEPAPTEPPIPDTYQLPLQATLQSKDASATMVRHPQPHVETREPAENGIAVSDGGAPSQGSASKPTQSN
jgi:hypothetical protein